MSGRSLYLRNRPGYSGAGKGPEALKILNQLKERSNRKYVSPYDIALVYAGLGNKERPSSGRKKPAWPVRMI